MQWVFSMIDLIRKIQGKLDTKVQGKIEQDVMENLRCVMVEVQPLPFKLT